MPQFCRGRIWPCVDRLCPARQRARAERHGSLCLICTQVLHMCVTMRKASPNTLVYYMLVTQKSGGCCGCGVVAGPQPHLITGPILLIPSHRPRRRRRRQQLVLARRSERRSRPQHRDGHRTTLGGLDNTKYKNIQFKYNQALYVIHGPARSVLWCINPAPRQYLQLTVTRDARKS